MAPLSYPLRFLVVALAGWINEQQREVIAYLQTGNRVLREQLARRRLHFTDDQRIRLAAKAKHLRRSALQEIGTIVSPDTLLRWHRQLIARKYDGDSAAGAPHGDGESRLGVYADSRGAGESGQRRRARDHRHDPQAARH